MKDNRFIEDSFPLKEVSTESAREKNIRHGHISTLHIWWARRPLASSRATSYAALIPAPKSVEEWNKKKQFIIELSKWENSLNLHLIEKAKRDILEANNGRPLKVLDPFAGGGAIPLEALRLGCETYAGEYNPVAVLILKCTLEYPQKYGKSKKINVKSGIIETEREIDPLLVEEGYDEEYAKAVVSYLELGVNRLADYNSSLTVWAVAGEFIAHTFGRQALPMVWDYFELNPWSNATGDWKSSMDWIFNVLSQIPPVEFKEVEG